MKRLPYLLLATIAAAGCNKTPEHVIPPEDMAPLLADLYMAESMVEQHRDEYNNDSSRRLVKQSVLAKYGYDAVDLDTSLMWYGQHFDQYMKVNDQTVAILEKRDKDLGAAIVQSNATFYGDSVDVWPYTRYAVAGRRMPSRHITLDIAADENWEKGDVYIWRAKLTDDNSRSVRWNMLAHYSDSTFDYLNATTSIRGWNEVTFATDTTKTLTALTGYFEPLANHTAKDNENKADKDVWIDSISLVRKRYNPDAYMQRGRLRQLDKIHMAGETDSVANDSLKTIK